MGKSGAYGVAFVNAFAASLQVASGLFDRFLIVSFLRIYVVGKTIKQGEAKQSKSAKPYYLVSKSQKGCLVRK